jgi:hypothetical protein
VWFRRAAAPADPRTDAWAALAARLEAAPLAEEALAALEAEVPEDVGRVAAPHHLPRTRGPWLVAFDALRPDPHGRGGPVPRPVLHLRGTPPVGGTPAAPVAPPWPDDVALRAFPNDHPLLARLEAGRAGATSVATDDPAFDAAVGVVAHDAPRVAAWLGHDAAAPVRAALRTLLRDAALPEARLVLGADRLAWQALAPVEPPLDALETAAVHLFGVWAALDVRAHRADPTAA